MTEETEGNEASTSTKVGRRPTAVIQRDRQVASTLVNANKPLSTISEELNMGSNLAYGSLWRLRKKNLVEKIGTGSRTPEWHLTDEGHAFVKEAPVEPVQQVTAQAEQQEAPAPAPEQPQPQPEQASVPRF